MIKGEAVDKSPTRQHLRDAVEINYGQVCSLNYPTVYDCVLWSRFCKARGCIEAGASSVRAGDLGTVQGSPHWRGKPVCLDWRSDSLR